MILKQHDQLERLRAKHARGIASAKGICERQVCGLREAGVTADRVAENLARGRTLAEAHRRLTRSPSHRANLLDEGLDAMGFGVARLEGVIYLVELFAARPSMSARGE